MSKNDDALRSIERSMVAIRRNIAKRGFGRVLTSAMEGRVDMAHLAVLDALVEGTESDVVTVGAVAEHFGVDPSRASRMVGSAVDAGLVRRVASQDDARRVGLELTPAGNALLDEVAALRQAWMSGALDGFSDSERAQFAGLLERFIAGLQRVTLG